MSEYGLLTLTRSEGESLKITTAYGEEIFIHFHTFGNKNCKVGIDAELDTEIVRTEFKETLKFIEAKLIIESFE